MDKELFGEQFYRRAIEQEGVDYNFYGDWQRSYAKMVISITDIIKTAADDRESLIVDVGCACGVTLRAFKEANVFGHHLGVEISDYLINHGKPTHGFSDDEMIQCDITEDKLPLGDNTVTLLHCTHTLEHVTEDKLDFIIKEFKRVLNPDGFGFVVVPAIKPGNPKEVVAHEETHFIVQTMNWWRAKFAKYFKIDNGIRKAFKESKFGPTVGDESTFYDHYNAGWTIFGLRKEK